MAGARHVVGQRETELLVVDALVPSLNHNRERAGSLVTAATYEPSRSPIATRKDS